MPDDQCKREITVSPDQHYNLPVETEPVFFRNNIIVVSPQFGQWIVLKNSNQLSLYNDLANGLSIKDLLNKSSLKEDLEYLLEEIEGRHFFKDCFIEPESAFTLRIYLTKRCNLRCPHCFVYAGLPLEHELSFSEIQELVRNSVANGCNKIILTGGEPTLHPDFIRILQEINKYRVHVQVLSNGTTWTPALVDAVKGLIDEIQISIDGYDEKSNSIVRGPGSFEAALFSVEEFIKRKIFVAISLTPVPELLFQHAKEYVDFGKRLLAKYGRKRIELVFARELFSGREFEVDWKLNRKYGKATEEIQNALYPDNKLMVFVNKHQRGNITTNCGFGNLTINSNGDVYYCGRVDSAVSHGNIRTTPYDEIFTRRAIARQATSVQTIVPCCNCILRFICGGGSRLSCFKGLAELSEITNQTIKTVSRECSQEQKDEILQLMVDSDSYLCY